MKYLVEIKKKAIKAVLCYLRNGIGSAGMPVMPTK
jgi:hypothetical protein